MPIRSRRPEDDKPLFRAINEHQRLWGPVRSTTGTTQNGTAQTQTAPRPTEEATQTFSGGATTGGAAKGPVSSALDRAQENNWVYPSVADAARRSGLVEKLDELVKGLSGR